VSLLGLFAAEATAQDMQNFKPAVGTWNYFSVEGASTAAHGEFVPSLYLSYAHQPLVIRDGNDKVLKTYVEQLATANLLLTVGLWERLELGVDLPLSYVSGDIINTRGDDGVGVGDLRVLPKLRLFGLKPGSKGPGVGIALTAPLSLPTGDKNKYVGADQVIINPKLVLEARGAGFSFVANGGVRFRPEKKEVENLELDHEVTYGAGAKVELGTPMMEAIAEVYGAAAITDIKGDSRSSPLEGLLGLRIFTYPGPVISLGGGTGIIADYGSPAYRLFFGLAWHRRDYDRDKDGLQDDVDKCPDEPEDKDGFEDKDGCADLDNDQDGILDLNDKCPDEPEDKDNFEDEDGCPDPDNDGDNILDINDKCPNKAENINQYQDTDGCPDLIPDTDGDGLNDLVDKCPHDPEDKDGFQDEDGCPDPDNDGDKILDINDKCPMRKETINGHKDEDGCPDRKLTMVKVTKEEIKILKKVYFHTNKSTIKPKSFPILDEVAVVLDVEQRIKLIQVQGHTDSRGKDSYNMKLSQDRAESVRRYLIKKGIAGERLEAKGFGETDPIEDNKTRKGRADNRRVEFKILEQ